VGPLTCAGDGDCGTGTFCDGNLGFCLAAQAPGGTCDPGRGGRDCASGSCVDGVCCDGACDGLCVACVSTKTRVADGTCAPIATGTDPDGECPLEEAATCGSAGVCNGASACRQHADGTICATRACDPARDGPCVYGCQRGRCETSQPMPAACSGGALTLSRSLRLPPAAEGQRFVRCGTLGPEGGWQVTLSPDGRRLAARTSAGTVRLIATDSWSELVQLASPLGKMNAVAFSPDSTRLATLSGEMGQVAIWRAEDGSLERSFAAVPSSTLDPEPGALAFSGDGGRLATTVGALIDLDTGTASSWAGQPLTAPLTVNPQNLRTASTVFRMQFMAEDRLLFLDVLGNAPGNSPRSRSLTLHDPVVGRSLSLAGGNYVVLNGYALSPDARWVAVTQVVPWSWPPFGLLLYSATTGEKVAEDPAATDFQVLSFSGDASELFGVRDGSLEVRRARDLAVLRRFPWPADRSFLGLSPQGWLVVAASGSTLWWDPELGRTVRTVPFELTRITWSANGQLEVGTGTDGALFHLWRAGDGAELCAPPGRPTPLLTAMATSPDAATVALGSDGLVIVAPASGTMPGTVVATGRGPLVGLAVNNEGTRVAVQAAPSPGNTVAPVDVLDVASGDGLLQVELVSDPSSDVRFALSPDGRHLAYDDGKGGLQVASVAGGSRVLSQRPAALEGWSADGTQVGAWAPDDEGVTEFAVFALADGSKVLSYPAPSATRRAMAADWSRSVGQGGPSTWSAEDLSVWSAPDAALLRTWPGQAWYQRPPLAIAPDGSFVSAVAYLIHTRAQDFTVNRVWDVASGAELRIFSPRRPLAIGHNRIFTIEGANAAVWCR
jgi:WD40 repeat protein